MRCFAPGCELAGTAWPTILIGQQDGGPPFRLEIPRAVCPEHQPAFEPAVFLTEGACTYIRWLVGTWKMSDPDFANLAVEWRPFEQMKLLEVGGSEARFCAPITSKETNDG